MIRKGVKVTLVKLPERHIERLKIGAIGEVLGVRHSDKNVLVKWRGKSCPVSHIMSELKEI